METTAMVEAGECTRYALQLSDAERTRYRFMATRAVEEEGERWRRAGVVGGARVADVGCGPGAVLVELARLVTTTGEALGIEPDPAARAAAHEELDGAGLSTTRVLAGTGDATGLERGSWDCVMLRHVLYHTGGAAQRTVAHLAELLRPGGHLYVVDSHAEGFCLSPDDAEIREQFRRYAEFQRGRGNNPHIGPQVGALMRHAGLEVVERAGWYNVVPAGILALGGPMRAAQDAMIRAAVLSAEEAELWDTQRRRYAQRPGATLWAPLFVTVGRRDGWRRRAGGRPT
jgi:SAM-dependent methyltransferase